MVNTIIVDDYFEMSRIAAKIVAEQIISKPDSVLGFATGSTPIGMYRELVKMYREGKVNFANTITFNLDEYWPMSKKSEYSYHFYMNYYFFNHVNIKRNNIYIPDGEISRSKIYEYCRWYEEKIKEFGGIDLQILGIGGGYYNSDEVFIGAHIGFNEPGSSFNSRTRLVRLSEQTRSDNSRFFMRLEDVPYYAITMGIATIMEAKRIVLLASGEHKANSIREAIEGEITVRVPASILQKHRDVTFIIDRGAASRLTRVLAPWLYEEIDWENEVEKLSRGVKNLIDQAITWTSNKIGKPIPLLTYNDIYSQKLGGLLKWNLDLLKDHVMKNLEAKIITQQKLPRNCRFLIFSPHPDDDVICVGATMRLLIDAGNEINVAYMVSGNIAVREEDVLEKLHLLINGDQVESIKRKILDKTLPLSKLLKLRAKVRENEAINAARILGIPRDNLFFLKMPFYETGIIFKKPLSSEDVRRVRNIIEEVQPDVIMIPGEITDPHGTHGKCIEAIVKALKKTKMKDKLEIWLYKGGWEEYLIYEVDVIVPFDEKIMSIKIEAIKQHESQLNPMFQGLDPRPFWERALHRNRINGLILKRLGLTSKPYAEFFRKIEGTCKLIKYEHIYKITSL